MDFTEALAEKASWTVKYYVMCARGFDCADDQEEGGSGPALQRRGDDRLLLPRDVRGPASRVFSGRSQSEPPRRRRGSTCGPLLIGAAAASTRLHVRDAPNRSRRGVDAAPRAGRS